MMDERREENASLFVAGALSAQESRAFENELRADAELQELVRELHDSTSALARAQTPVAPPVRLKNKILAQIAT